MDQKLRLGPRVAIFAAALALFIASLGVFVAVPLTPWLGAGPALFGKILGLILSAQALGWAGTLAVTGSPGRAWRAMGGEA